MTKLLPVIIWVVCGSGFYHENPNAPSPGSDRRDEQVTEAITMK
ncbi:MULTISPECIES: hypothetical protein [unclassified Microcoleus]